MEKSDLVRACGFLALLRWGFKLGLIICSKRCGICWCYWFLLSLTTCLRVIRRYYVKVIRIFSYSDFWGIHDPCVRILTPHPPQQKIPKHTHTNSYMEFFMESRRFGDESPLFLLQVTHSFPHTILYIKWTTERDFPKQTEVLYFEVGNCISKPEICMKDICAVPSGQVFN